MLQKIPDGRTFRLWSNFGKNEKGRWVHLLLLDNWEWMLLSDEQVLINGWDQFLNMNGRKWSIEEMKGDYFE